MTVTVLTCLFGDGRDGFLPGWLDATAAAGPDATIVVTDRPRDSGVTEVITTPDPDWRWPISWHWNHGFAAAETDWVWLVGVDDRIRPDALRLLDGRDVDVLQVGYHRDGIDHCPPPLTPDAILAAPDNQLVACSPIRRAAWAAVGGFPDVAFEDWGMWRRLARAGRTFGYASEVAYDLHWNANGATVQYQTAANVAEALAQ